MSETPPQSPPSRPQWWGEYPIAPGARSYWRLGTLECLVERANVEWTVTSSLGVDPLDETVLYEPQTTRAVQGKAARIVCRAATDTLHLEPRLLDRTVVSRPLSTVSILAGTTAALYVTTPTRVLLMTGDETLLDLPSTTLRRTWIGPNTRTGEVGFATRTTARLDLSYLTVHPTRAVTRVAITNAGTAALKLDRINLPVRQLALYVGTGSRLWTSALRLTVRDGAVEDVQIEPGAPDIAGDAAELAPALEHLDRGRMRRVFDALFS